MPDSRSQQMPLVPQRRMPCVKEFIGERMNRLGIVCECEQCAKEREEQGTRDMGHGEPGKVIDRKKLASGDDS